MQQQLLFLPFLGFILNFYWISMYIRKFAKCMRKMLQTTTTENL